MILIFSHDWNLISGYSANNFQRLIAKRRMIYLYLKMLGFYIVDQTGEPVLISMG